MLLMMVLLASMGTEGCKIGEGPASKYVVGILTSCFDLFLLLTIFCNASYYVL